MAENPPADLASDRNPYAFPAHGPDDEYNGMTLRDWFAGQALMGMLTSPANDSVPMPRYASAAYEIADAMLAERERKS